MTVREPSYYQEFRCVGGGCPLTCCRDWSIVPDGGALEDHKTAPAGLRERIAQNLVTDEDGDVCFRLTPEGKCALLDGDGLCAIQRQWGEEHLCAHCAAYPRFNEEYGCLTENSLAVSCPEAARLTMERGIFPLVEREDGRDDPPFDGVDGELLAGLIAARSAALELLSGEAPLWNRLLAVLEFASGVQELMDTGDWEGLAGWPVPAVREELPDGLRTRALRLPELLAQLPPLRPEWPELLRRRGAELAALSTAQYDSLTEAYAAARPRWELHLERLAQALLFRHWPKAVNDGLIFGRAAFAACACWTVHVLSLLGWRENNGFSDGDEQLLWAMFSREVEHDGDNLSDLQNFLQEALDNGGLLL